MPQFFYRSDGKPDGDHIERPARRRFPSSKKSPRHNPAVSYVAKPITEIYDYVRCVLPRVGEPRCPEP